MHIHLIGVCGTGMGAFAGLLASAGHQVTGSDTAFYPPIGPALTQWGVKTYTGWDPTNLDPAPDWVVVGNVCRPDNPEARAAIDRGLPYTSMPTALAQLFLRDRPSWVVAGSHGKTTTTSLVAHLAHEAGLDPGLFVGGVPRGIDTAFRAGGATSPFVLEGDEYDSAFFDKNPKMWRYHPNAAILTNVEHDHVDIYPDAARYRDAFVELVQRMPETGLLVAWAGSAEVRAVVRHAPCRVCWYALDDDEVDDIAPVWTGAMVAPQGGAQPFDLFVGGTFCGRVLSPLVGRHNVRNGLAGITLLAEQGGVPVHALTPSLARFAGVRRRQELVGVVAGVRVYDDFAHHPTEVRETLRALRARHPAGRLIATFEPRSATACRNVHQDVYPDALSSADIVVLPPIGRSGIPDEERLDMEVIASALRGRGRQAETAPDTDHVLRRLTEIAAPGDTVVIMSNGPFDQLHDRLIVELTRRVLPE